MMTYTLSLFLIISGVTLYSFLFLSRNKYVRIVALVLSSGLAAAFALLAATLFGIGFFLAMIWGLLTGKNAFDAIIGTFFSPFQGTGTNLLIYLLAATPFLYALRNGPQYTKQILVVLGAIIVACAVVSGMSYRTARQEYFASVQNITPASLPQRPENIALKRIVYAGPTEEWRWSESIRRACDALCQRLLGEAGAKQVRLLTIPNASTSSVGKSFVYRLGQNQECTQTDTSNRDGALNKDRDVVIREDLRVTFPPDYCLLAREANPSDTGFVEITLEHEKANSSEKVALIEISDLTTLPGTLLMRSTEKTASYIAFPPMQDSNGVRLRLDVHFGAFRKGDFDDVFRQILTKAMGYKISVITEGTLPFMKEERPADVR